MEFEHDAPIEGHSGPGTSRRAVLLKAAFGVGALTIGSQVLPIDLLVPAAGAQAAPEQVDDATLAGFNQGLVLAAANLYRRVIDAKLVTDPKVIPMLGKFQGHHTEWAGLLRGIAADKAPNRPNSVLVQTSGGQIDAAASADRHLQLLFDVENSLAATLASALGSMTTADHRKTIAPVLPVIGQHAAMLGTLLKKADSDHHFLPPFQSSEGALDMTKYTAQ